MHTHIYIYVSLYLIQKYDGLWIQQNTTCESCFVCICIRQECVLLYISLILFLLTAGFDIYLWRVLYYTDWGSVGHVGKVALDGSYRVVLTTAENPNDLIISDNKLLIINNKQPSAEIIEIDLANSNSAISRRQLSSVVSWLGPWIESNNHVLFYGFQ